MTPTEVKSIVLAWLDYQDHDHTLPGHMGPERIEHFSRKMAEPEQGCVISDADEVFKMELERRWPDYDVLERAWHNSANIHQFLGQVTVELLKPHGSTKPVSSEPEQAEPKPAELTAEDFVRVPGTYWCGGCYFDGLEIGCTITDKLSEELGICEGIIFKLKEDAK